MPVVKLSRGIRIWIDIRYSAVVVCILATFAAIQEGHIIRSQLPWEYRVRPAAEGVFIEINDATEGWMPLFGANNRGDFVGMPTCWSFDERSNGRGTEPNVIMPDIDLLTQKKTLREIKKSAASKDICSVPGVTFMSALSDHNGNVLHIIPGQGYKYYEKPVYQVLTNFSPFKMDQEQHPWMG